MFYPSNLIKPYRFLTAYILIYHKLTVTMVTRVGLNDKNLHRHISSILLQTQTIYNSHLSTVDGLFRSYGQTKLNREKIKQFRCSGNAVYQRTQPA